MNTSETKNQTTREKLLESACNAFQEKGFRNATIAEICAKAGVNVALVNYHFGDKNKLYEEVLKHTFEAALEAHRLSMTPQPHLPPEEQLYLFVLGRIQCIFSDGPDGTFPKLMVKEMAEPTPALAVIVEEAIRPQADILENIIRQLSGMTDGMQLQLASLSVVSQCLHLAFSEPIQRQLFGPLSHNHELAEKIARHITNFSIAGIQAMQEDRPQKGTENAKKRRDRNA